MTIVPDGIDAAALREDEFHPKTKAGSTITAWQRRASTHKKTVSEVNKLRLELDALKQQIKNRPF